MGVSYRPTVSDPFSIETTSTSSLTLCPVRLRGTSFATGIRRPYVSGRRMAVFLSAVASRSRRRGLRSSVVGLRRFGLDSQSHSHCKNDSASVSACAYRT